MTIPANSLRDLLHDSLQYNYFGDEKFIAGLLASTEIAERLKNGDPLAELDRMQLYYYIRIVRAEPVGTFHEAIRYVEGAVSCPYATFMKQIPFKVPEKVNFGQLINWIESEADIARSGAPIMIVDSERIERHQILHFDPRLVIATEMAINFETNSNDALMVISMDRSTAYRLASLCSLLPVKDPFGIFIRYARYSGPAVE